MSRDLDLLDHRFRPMVDASLVDCAAAFIDILVTCTYRSNLDQDALYAQGRTAPGAIVTNARAGQSAHNFGLALDVVPIVHGKPEWTGTAPEWTALANIFQARGCEWLGAPGSLFHELAHFQMPRWKDFAANPEEAE